MTHKVEKEKNCCQQMWRSGDWVKSRQMDWRVQFIRETEVWSIFIYWLTIQFFKEGLMTWGDIIELHTDSTYFDFNSNLNSSLLIWLHTILSLSTWQKPRAPQHTTGPRKTFPLSGRNLAEGPGSYGVGAPADSQLSKEGGEDLCNISHASSTSLVHYCDAG